MPASARRKDQLERKLIALGALLLGAYNLYLTMLRSPFSMAELDDLVPMDIIRGGRFVLVLLGMVLIIASLGLWHGKRSAWLIALVCSALSATVHPVKDLDLPGILVSCGLLGALVGARPQFPARTDPPTMVRGLVLLIVAAIAAFAYSIFGLYFLDAEFREPVSLTAAVRESARLLLILPSTNVDPVTRHGEWFIDSSRVIFLFTVAVGVVQLLRPVVYRARTSAQERARVEQILERFGDSALAFFAILPDKSYFFSRGGNAVLAYRVSGNTAVVMGDPIGREAEFDELIETFQDHCELNSWSFSFLQARPRFLQLYKRHDLKALKTGEEGLIRLADFTLSGTAMKHIRATMNRFEREGYRAVVKPPPHDVELLARLREVSDAWLMQGRRRERGFTMGYFDAGLLQRCELILAIGPAGDIVGFANIIPSYRANEATFDLLRYQEAPKGIADFLCVSLIDCFRDRGYSAMNLGLAPFSGLEKEDISSVAAQAMRILYRHGSFLMRYQGLRDFKAKFGPVWEPRYLVYPSDAQLIGVALATMRAGEAKTLPLGQPLPKRSRPSRGGPGEIAILPGG